MPSSSRPGRPFYRTLFLVALLGWSVFLVPAVAALPAPAQARLPATVDSGGAGSSSGRGGWLWGPEPIRTLWEPGSADARDQRLVEYFDKGRLEITPAPESGAPATRSPVCIVRDMVDGTVANLHSPAAQRAPADIPVVGDVADAEAPTYASFRRVASVGQPRRAVSRIGEAVAQQIDRLGRVSRSSTVPEIVRVAAFVENTGHNVPDVFWRYLHAPGDAFQDVDDTAAEPAFVWQDLFGNPITEPYWTVVGAGAEERQVLVQLFERRTLVYDRSAAEGEQVQAGDAGRHYLDWRYAGTYGAAVPGDGRVDLILGNGGLERHLVVQNGRLRTVGLRNTRTGREYSLAPRGEFTLALQAGSRRLQLDSEDFQVSGFDWERVGAGGRRLRVAMLAPVEMGQVEVVVVYAAAPDRGFLRKWLEVRATGLEGWSLRAVTLEDLALQPYLQPLAPYPRYRGHLGTPPDFTQREVRTSYPPQSRFLGYSPEAREGMFFFTEHLLGRESYAAAEGLTLSHEEAAPLGPAYTSGRATIGVFEGAPELGFQRFTSYVQDFYSIIGHKPMPVYYSTWYPYREQIDQGRVADVLGDLTRRRGYDALYLDAGWEGDTLLVPSPERFPQGLEAIARRAERAGLKLGLWISPFGWSERNFATHRQHPEWHIASREFVSQGRRLGPFCPNSGAYDYVRGRLEDLVRRLDLRVLYWDSADWSLPPCPASPGDPRDDQELRVAASKRLAGLLEDLHRIQPELVTVLWNEPVDIHRLAYTDQNQFSDIWGLPLVNSELMRRQHAYQISFEHPYYAYWSDWYGVSYAGNQIQNYGQPLPVLEYAEMSMLGNGAYHAGASLDFARAPRELADFVQRLLLWRQRFAPYFTVYQHVLGFPDGSHVDGEGHLIDGRGFIILNNPSRTAREVRLPLDEVELELSADRAYAVRDWSDLQSGRPLGSYRPGQAPTIAMPPLTVKVFSVDLP